MNIFSNTSKYNTIALIFFSAIAIAAGCVDSFYLDIPNEICEVSSVIVFFICVKIFVDNYRVASKERSLRKQESEERVCLIRRQTGVCPLMQITCGDSECCQRKYNSLLKTDAVGGNMVICKGGSHCDHLKENK